MIFYVVLAAAAVNFVLGVIALTKGQTRLNLSFFFLSLLLGLWNLFIVFWAGMNMEIFSRINFMVISLIPVAGIFFVLSLYRIKKGPLAYAPCIILVPALGIIAYTAGTFISAPLLAWYDSKWCKIMIFAYEFTTLFFVYAALAYNYGKLHFKQEKIKIRYVMAAFLILYAGGMLDLAGGAGLFHFPVQYMGNICNVIYAVIIFTAIFRARLFNVGVLFKKVAAYVLLAGAAGSVYLCEAVFLSGSRTALVLSIFIFTAVFVYLFRTFYDAAYNLADSIGGRTGAEEAKRVHHRIMAMQADENEKIRDTLAAFRTYLEIDAAIFIKAGDYYMPAWETPGSPHKKLVEGSAMPLRIIIRYETENKKEIELLDRFGADVIMPLVYGGEITGVLSGKKQTADISLAQDEVDLILDMAAAIAAYMKVRLMQKQQMEDENMKRIGMMSRQMAHEIKNPLAALWGAAQLIEGKSDADRDNLVIIKEEMKRLTNILDSWQDFSRDLKLERRQAGVEYIIAEALNLVNLQGHKAEIQFQKPADKISVSIDVEKMKQVLLNVLLNAIDASAFRESPLIEIQVIKKKRYADIKIRDNGEGIKKENLLKVKEPMFTSKPKGSGLGLAISERIMKAHGGAILLDSDGESFTEVTLSIPLE